MSVRYRGRRGGGNKFGNIRTVVDGLSFDSRKEARRYQELLLLRHAGEVASFECQPRFVLVVNGVTLGHYTPDFRVVYASGEVVIEDVKGGQATKTAAYRLRRKVFEACHAPLVVTEV